MVAPVEKLLPHNVEAESCVLGSVLIDPEAIAQVADFLRADDFYRNDHRVIFQAALDLFESGVPADLVTLVDELERRGKLVEVGGISFVSALANQVPTSANVAYYAGIVERAGVLRRLIHAAGQIAAIAYSEPDAQSALDQAEQQIYGIATRFQGRARAVRLGSAVSSLIDTLGVIQERRDQGVPLGVPSGFADLDKLTGGFQRGDLIIIAARPGMGKTAMLDSMARASALRHGMRWGIFSMEMSCEQVAQRFMAMQSGVDMQRLRLGYLTAMEWADVSRAAGELEPADIYLDDTAGLTLMQARSRARKMVLDHGVDIVAFDYLQLMHASGGSEGRGFRQENRQQEVSAITRGLKELARELDVPVVALSQLSRAVESRAEKVPELSDLRDSGEIEQAADIVAFIYRDEVYNPDTDRRNIADIKVAKHRNGPTGTCSLYWQAAQVLYRDLELVSFPAAASAGFGGGLDDDGDD